MDDRAIAKTTEDLIVFIFVIVSLVMTLSYHAIKHKHFKLKYNVSCAVSMYSSDMKRTFSSRTYQIIRYSLIVIAIGLTLLQLFRIDLIAPLTVNWQLPVSNIIAQLILLLLVISQIFMLPYLLKIKLSPLAHLVSAILVFIAPWGWTLITVWALGTGLSTLQLGNYIATPGSLVSIVLNLLWLAGSFVYVSHVGLPKLPFLSKKIR